MRDIKQIAFEEVVKNRKYCAVIAVEFANHTITAYELNEILFFTAKREYDEWLKAVDAIYEPADRPIRFHTIYNPSAEWC